MRQKILIAFSLLLFAWNTFGATKIKDLPERYRTWLGKDVSYIITEEERKQFLALSTDDAREGFIQSFWEVRNPARGTNTNPFKDEHYRRIEYANSHFGRQSNTPGWMTDQGRTYIEFGKPTSQHKFVGYGQIYPLDLWFYSNESGNPSFPPFFYVLFYIPEDVGEFKFYRPNFDGPLKLVRGSSFNANKDVYNFLKRLGGDVAHAAFSLVPNDPLDTTDFTTDMGSDMIISRIQNFGNDPFNVRRIRDLRALNADVNSFLLISQEKKLDINSFVLADPLGRYWLDYGVSINEQKLGKADPATGQLLLSLAYHLFNEKGELIVEDAEDRAYPAFDRSGPDATFLPFVVANRIPVEPGQYRLDVQVINRAAGKTFQGELRFAAGQAADIALSGPLVSDSVEQVKQPSSVTPFQYFGVQFHPIAGNRFDRRLPVRLLFELHQPSTPVTAAPAREWQLEYVIANLNDREAREKSVEDVAATEFREGRLLKSKTISVSQLKAGEYRLVVNVRQRGEAQVITSANVPLRIEDSLTAPGLYISSLSRALANPGVTPYIRGLEAVAQHHQDEATQYLTQALQEAPSNTFAGQLLVQLFFNQRSFSSITGLYKRLGIDSFKASPETLAQVSLSFWNTGDSAQAKEIVEASKAYFPNNPLLAATGSRYTQNRVEPSKPK